MISIKKNYIKLHIPKFNCDENAVDERLKSHPLLRHLNCYGLLVLTGMMTQKDRIIYKKTQHHSIIVLPTNSINSLEKTRPEENFVMY